MLLLVATQGAGAGKVAASFLFGKPFNNGKLAQAVDGTECKPLPLLSSFCDSVSVFVAIASRKIFQTGLQAGL